MSYDPGYVIAGKYRLIESIGGGAMGEVFKAEHELMHKSVAIKILHPNFAKKDEFIERFKREAQATASIEHQNICTVTDFDTLPDGGFYLVMEFLDGETLQSRLKDYGALPTSLTVFIMQQLLSVLQAAHDHGIVHRDIKPDNIFLISRDGTDSFVKLFDFGIAHQDEDSQGQTFKTQAGCLYGTPQYISPEQANGEAVDHRTDLYSCGIILYQMLTGQLPFDDPRMVELLHKQLCEPPPHLHVEDIPHGEMFDEIIQKLLAKKPDDRYQSATEVSEALARIPIKPEAYMAASSVMMRLSALELAQQVGEKEEPAKKRPRYFRKRYLVVAVVVCLIVIAILLYVLMTMPKSNMLVNVQDPLAVGIGGQSGQDVAVVEDNSVYEPQPFEFVEDGFKTSFDEVLKNDSELSKAVEIYYSDKDYEGCLAVLDAQQRKYGKHPNYMRLRLMALNKLKDRIEFTKTFIELIQLVPDATRNPSVREGLYAAIEDKTHYEEVMRSLKAVNSDNMAVAIAEAIVQSPYDRHDTRRSRLKDVLDALPQEKLPLWRQTAVEAWTNVKRENCSEREALVKKAVADPNAPADEIFAGLIAPLHDNKLKLCAYKRNSSKKIDCNQCFREWIDQQYEARKPEESGSTGDGAAEAATTEPVGEPISDDSLVPVIDETDKN